MMKNERDIVYCQQGPATLAPTGVGALNRLRFVFKDLFDVKGYVTGAGNPTWLATHSAATETSLVIRELLNQGAQCVGRVQTDELAYSLNGQNIHYGTPINPKAQDCIPGGSSSGSAVVVARGDADFAIGTDTGGSVRVPASYCGIYGLRPTLGRFSLEHTFELSKRFDTVGCFAQTLPMLKMVFQALANVESDDVCKTINMPASLNTPEFSSRLAKLVNRIEATNFSFNILDDCALFNDLTALSDIFRILQGFEIIQTHGEWLNYHLAALDPVIAQRVSWSRTLTEDHYKKAQHQQAIFRAELTSMLEMCGGVIVLPTTPAGPPKLDTPAQDLAAYRSQVMGLTAIAGLSGCPQLHIPVLSESVGPCGFSLLGLPNTELLLINTALKLVENGRGL